jgi:hypothetical protein
LKENTFDRRKFQNGGTNAVPAGLSAHIQKHERIHDMSENDKKSDDLQGEGNYDAAREYNEKAAAFAQQPEKVKAAADQAKDALESSEKNALEAAEAAGKSRAKK